MTDPYIGPDRRMRAAIDETRQAVDQLQQRLQLALNGLSHVAQMAEQGRNDSVIAATARTYFKQAGGKP